MMRLCMFSSKTQGFTCFTAAKSIAMVTFNQFLLTTSAAHTPDNTFLGFAVEGQALDDVEDKKSISLGHGKSGRYWKVRFGFSLRTVFCVTKIVLICDTRSNH